MIPAVVPVTPAPSMQQFCKPVSSISLKKLGAYSANPIKLTKKGPLSGIPVREGTDVLENVEQLDTTVFQVDVVDENGATHVYTLVVPSD